MADDDFIKHTSRVLFEGMQILAREGLLTAAGHLSARIPGTNTFLINPRYAAVLADADDLCVVDFDGLHLAGTGPIPSETPIHAAIYAARPDVMSVLHCHPRNAIIVGLLDAGFVPVHREAACFAGGVPVFPDSRNITSMSQASALAEQLGDRSAAFLCGHGIVVADLSIEATCVSAIRLENSCEDQLKVMSVGAVRPLEEAHGGAVAPGRASKGAAAYRNWPFLLHKHGLRGRDEIKASLRPPRGGPAPQ